MATTILPFSGVPAGTRESRFPILDRIRHAPANHQLSIWLTRIRLRDALRRELLPQPDSVLADAGFTREALQDEVAKPFWRA